MSNPPLRIWRRGSSKSRRHAAEQALAESPFAATAVPDNNAPTEVDSELASMRRLIQTLEHLPEQAWNREPHTATAKSPAGNVARQPSRKPQTWVTPVRSGVFAAIALAFVIGALIHPFSGTTRSRLFVSRPSAHVVLRPLTGTSNTGQAVAYIPGGDQMLVRIQGLPRSAPGTYYELWLMTSNTDLVSVTSFRIRTTGTNSLKLLLPDDPSHYKYLDISVQHVGDHGAISNDNVLRGPIHA